ncbi:hypothetical protein [Nostoc sp.]|uniref:hypothetical protein n=1 Tax=Nostoc sp. TaxID=1180 RepID=UPI002FF7069D
MKISHKLVANFVGVSLLRSVVGTVAIADNGCAIPETVRSCPMPFRSAEWGISLLYLARAKP